MKNFRTFGPENAPPRAQSSHSAMEPSSSQLNSDQSASESESDGEGSEFENLGFAESDYFHDKKYGEDNQFLVRILFKINFVLVVFEDLSEWSGSIVCLFFFL